jgi:hypothetical protein
MTEKDKILHRAWARLLNKGDKVYERMKLNLPLSLLSVTKPYTKIFTQLK